jgi:hypothetical protein
MGLISVTSDKYINLDVSVSDNASMKHSDVFWVSPTFPTDCMLHKSLAVYSCMEEKNYVQYTAFLYIDIQVGE